MEQIKVLVVDDSSLMRKLIKKMVEEDPQLTVVDTAMNGIFALKKIEKYDPDVVLLDIEMPEMNGIEFLKKCKEIDIDIPIIVLSSTGKNRPEITLKCLELGAKDFIIKPSGTISLDIDHVQQEVISKVKFFHWEHPKGLLKKSDLKDTIDKINKEETQKVKDSIARDAELIQEKHDIVTTNINEKIKALSLLNAVVIGISTGGPHALRKIMPLFPADFPLPIMIVQHMPPGFTKEFANGLNEICKLKVKEAEEHDKIMPGTIYIARGDSHLKIVKSSDGGYIHLEDSPQVNGHKPSAEILFESATELYKNRLIAVIMTGMGKDGARGIRKVKLNGGITIAQSERTCVVYGMPKVAVEMGGIDEILDLDDIPEYIINTTKKIMSNA